MLKVNNHIPGITEPNSYELVFLAKQRKYLNSINEIKDELSRFEKALNKLENKIVSGELCMVKDDEERIIGDKDRAAVKRSAGDLSRALVEFRKVRFT